MTNDKQTTEPTNVQPIKQARKPRRKRPATTIAPPAVSESVKVASLHSRVDWSDPLANSLIAPGVPVVVVRTVDGKWIAVEGILVDEIAAPVTVIQHMKSCDLRRKGLVWAVWDGTKLTGFWDTMPNRMPLYTTA